MRRIVIGLALASSLAPSVARAGKDAPLPEANAFVQGLAERQRQHEEAINDFTYDVRDIQETLDKNGAVKESRTSDYEVFHVQGRRVKRQVAKNGVAFTAEQLAKEDKEVQKRIKEVAERKAAGKTGDPPLSAVLARYDFRSVAREDVDGRPAIVMDFTPRPGKRDLDGDWVLRNLAGRIWVDEEEREIVRAEMRNTSKIKVALGIGASVSELAFALRFHKVDQGVWLPLRVEAQAVGRLALVKGFRHRSTQIFSRFRRFQVDAEEKVRS